METVGGNEYTTQLNDTNTQYILSPTQTLTKAFAKNTEFLYASESFQLGTNTLLSKSYTYNPQKKVSGSTYTFNSNSLVLGS